MSKEAKIWRRRVIIALLILGGLYFLGRELNWTIRDQMQQMHSGPVVLNGRTVGQSFIADRDSLCSIDLFMATSSPNHSGYIQLVLFEDGRSKIIRSATVKASAIKDNQYLSFIFEPVSNSRGKKFYFEVKGKFEPQDISIWFFSVEEAYPFGVGYVSGRKLGGDLKFSSLSKVSISNAVLEILQKVATAKPSFLGFSVFYALLLTCYLLVLVLFISRTLSLSKR